MILMKYKVPKSKRKKNTRQRGSHTHGWGAKKKHRGAGSRGGRGRAGTGKRGDAKKPSIWKNKDYFGKRGFKLKRKEKKATTLNYLEEKAESLFKKGLIEKNKDIYVVDIKKLGFDKLLSKGIVKKKFMITANEATSRAVEKVEKAGGKVKVLAQKEEKAEETVQEK